MHALYLAAALAVTLALAPAAKAGDLRMMAENVRSAAGNIIFALHRDGDPFPDAVSPFLGGFRRASVPITAMTFAGLPPGRYALVVIHDENMNRQLDQTVFGIPVEGFGFSNNARGLLSPPTFEAARFDLPADSIAEVRIRLIYLSGPG